MHHHFFICVSVCGRLGVLLPGKSQGQRSLVGDSPWGPREGRVTQWLSSWSCSPLCLADRDHSRKSCRQGVSPALPGGAFLSPSPLVYEVHVVSTLLSCISTTGIFLPVLVVLVSVTKSCSTLAAPWTVACQAPLSMGFFRREYWSGLLFPSPWESSWPRNWTQVSWIAGRFFTDWAVREAFLLVFCLIISGFYPSFLLFNDLRIQTSLDFTKDNVGMPICHSPYCLKVLRVKGRSRNFATLPTNLKSS